jgi:hypothetical protein
VLKKDEGRIQVNTAGPPSKESGEISLLSCDKFTNR